MIQLPVVDHPDAPTAGCSRHPPVGGLSGASLVEALLNEQQELSAVEQFAQWHDAAGANGLENELRYTTLLPTNAPGPGEQYAFEVDLDRCSGCKACVTACHTRNGLDELEAWRDVGLLIGGSRSAPFMQHVTTACHHCLEPACMAACPVNAYEKDPVTGIVRHLDDQCFGCQYCTLACPYDVPKYHAGKGIVRKCDMCSQRLAVGEVPACVQACPHEAIAIRVVNRAQVLEDAEAAVFLPAAPDPLHTYPTTTYKTKRPFPRNLLPADYYRVNPQHAHWPLVVMLVLTQLSVGAFTVGLILWQADASRGSQLQPLHAVSSLLFGLLALSASLFHLGRPQYAYRAVLGLRHSWLSREIVFFGVFAKLAAAYALAQVATWLWHDDAQGDTYWFAMASALAGPLMGWMVTASGAVGILCSVMIYAFTRRECWSAARTIVRFTLTATVLGVATAWLSVLLATAWQPSQAMFDFVRQDGPEVCRALMLIALSKLLWEAAIFRHLIGRRTTALRRSAMLQAGELSNIALARFALGLLGGLVMPCLLLRALPSLTSADLVPFAAMSGLLFAATLAGELLERYLFFAACAAPRMPGGIR